MYTFAQNNRGFTLLLASLIAALMLALGISIFRIANKEVILSSLGRDSQFAFYAADTGAECAVNWDFNGAFASATSTFTGATCAGQNLGALGGVAIGTPSTFQIEVANRCVRVSVTKNTTFPFTHVESRGYSATCTVVDAGVSRRVLERAVRIQY